MNAKFPFEWWHYQPEVILLCVCWYLSYPLDEQLIAFLELQTGGNRSEYLNRLLVLERKRTIEAQLIKALQEDYSDPDYLAEIPLWDAVIADGLDDAEG